MDPSLPLAVDQLLQAFNSGDLAGLEPLLDPGMAFYGSMIRGTVRGPGAIAATFQATRGTLGIRHMEVLRWFGDWPEAAALAHFQGEGGHPTLDGALAFRFNPEGRLTRLGAYWDPGAFVRGKALAEGSSLSRSALADKDPRLQTALGTYVEAFNAGDEARHFSVMHPDLVYYGSLAKVRSQGVESAKGVFQAARSAFGVHRMQLRKVFGDWPEVAVLLDLARGDGGTESLSMFVFTLDAQGRITEISAFWDPRALFKRE